MVTDEEIAFMKKNIEKIRDENKALKENCRGLNSELEIVSTQVFKSLLYNIYIFNLLT